MGRIKLFKFHLKANRIASAYLPLREQALKIIEDISDLVGVSRTPQDALDDRILVIGSQLLAAVTMLANAKYVVQEDFRVFEGALTIAMCGKELAQVKYAAVHLQDNHATSFERCVAIADRVLYRSDLPITPESIEMLTKMLVIIELNIQQLVAQAFNDKTTVDTLQKIKLEIHASEIV